MLTMQKNEKARESDRKVGSSVLKECANVYVLKTLCVLWKNKSEFARLRTELRPILTQVQVISIPPRAWH